MNQTQIIHIGGGKRLPSNDIIMCKADVNYTTIYLQDGSSILTATNIGKIAGRMKDLSFYQPHRSYIINLNYVKGFEKDTLRIEMQNELKVVLSRRRAKEFTLLGY